MNVLLSKATKIKSPKASGRQIMSEDALLRPKYCTKYFLFMERLGDTKRKFGKLLTFYFTTKENVK